MNLIFQIFDQFRLEISCDNQSYGCDVMIKLDLLPHHLKECEHNPKKKVSCEQGCGLTVPKDEMKVTIDLFGEFFETLFKGSPQLHL